MLHGPVALVLDRGMSRGSSRNTYFVVLLAAFVFVSFYLYSTLDHAATVRRQTAERNEDEVIRLRGRVAALEKDLVGNEKQVEKLKTNLEQAEAKHRDLAKKQLEKENEVYDEKLRADKDLQKKQEADIDVAAEADRDDGQDKVADYGTLEKDKNVAPIPRGGKVAIVHDVLSRTSPLAQSNVCLARSNYSGAHTDVQMLDMYNIIPFDNIDGGVWKQGWPITYNADVVKNERKLEVIVIPHSHCDPGWIVTVEQYFEESVRRILNGMVDTLESKPDMRFIYAEMSFFEMWWKTLDETVRNKVRGFLKTGQLEIVTGGWVMTDEANAHYHSIITELFEGHEFIRNHVDKDYKPRSHWSIDPFGLSPTLPLLLSASNISDALIQRVHYSVKKKLAQDKSLEFMWRQLWGGDRSSRDVRTHVMPFYSYDIPHTCGPEPAVCCQFDFARLPGAGRSCDWGIPPEKINDNNVQRRAFMLYDQYRKKSQLYKTNVVLIPLGDDFRYTSKEEWNAQNTNYAKLFEYMNAQPDWNVNARFGTLSDYFSSLNTAIAEENIKLPVLSGDFFTYADRDDHYWSGYFTSRPFYKQLDRVLQHYLRSAEISFTLAQIKGNSAPDDVFKKLTLARRALSLFQHHDGVTGTAKDHVVQDYGAKMLRALNNCAEVIGASVGALFSKGDQPTPRFNLDEVRAEQNSLAKQLTVNVGSSLVLFNTLAQHRHEVACIHVDSPNAKLTEKESGIAPQQETHPVVVAKRGLFQIQQGVYEGIFPRGIGMVHMASGVRPVLEKLCFDADVPPLGGVTYKLDTSEGQAKLATVMGSVKPSGLDSFFQFTSMSSDFELSSGRVSALFSGITGFLKSVTLDTGDKLDVNAHFVKYGARGHKERHGGGDDLSGAYLFLPDGEAKRMEVTEPAYLVLEGTLIKRVFAMGPKNRIAIQQAYTISKGSSVVEIQNIVDLREQQSNIEVAMRMETSINSGDSLFTDLNGMQMIRRRRMLDKLPIQAHYYPMPASAFIEDSTMRLSLLGAQALGVASLKSGWLEVMLDRRLFQDDGRGLGQGVLDNSPTESRFRLLVEPLKADEVPQQMKDAQSNETVGFHSTLAHQESLRLHYPWIKLFSKDEVRVGSFAGLSAPLPCDTHLITMRTSAGPTDYLDEDKVRPNGDAAVVLHRTLPECRSKLEFVGQCATASNDMDLKSLLGVKSVTSSSLTMLYDQKEEVRLVSVQPQDVRTVKVTF